MGLPSPFTRFISEIFSSNGQPQRASHRRRTGFERPVLFFEAGGAAVLALVVALDAVVSLIERAG